ncbi:hypothetical protein LFYK43_19200 [Ligilactobacillus salitolerans]|uniref:NERD domain-containing protein n=1 Tax=Ligilactobacillus salitolerans TaxID=1808352 RepID=A0A401IV85_9LACO|nr:hypothetical protein LFYK43_19200 [Ligilactobacillus salitolerans]
MDKLVTDYFAVPELVIDDLNIVFDGQLAQIDKLIVTKGKLCLLDVKNYRGKYRYENNMWYCNERVLSNNIFRQIDRAHDILARIFQQNRIQLPIERVLCFMDPQVSFEVHQLLVTKIKQVAYLPQWLLDLKHSLHENQLKFAQQIKQLLAQYTVSAYRPQQDCPTRQLRTGICCSRCLKFGWEEQKHYLKCTHCGFCESKEHATVRTICQYGVLFFKHDLLRGELRWFLGKEINENSLKSTLYKNFQKIDGFKGKKSCYLNKGEEFEYWFYDQKDYFERLQTRGKLGQENKQFFEG